MASIETEVVVVGGGIAGLAMAVALGLGEVPTVLVDRLPAAAAAGDRRTTALLGPPVAVLRGLGIWPALAAEAAPLRRLRIVNERRGLFGGAEVVFDAREAGLDGFGYNIANGALRAALLGRLAGLDTVTHLRGAEFARLDARADRATIGLRDSRNLVAKLVVAADGRDSPVRAAAGIRVWRRAFGQTAIVTSFGHDRAHEDTSTEIHRPGGPFTLVPMAGRRSSVVWVERDADATIFLALPPEDFRAALQARSAGWLGRLDEIEPPEAYPLAGRLAGRFRAPRVALVAEAAHGLHPIGAQGLNLSLRDVACLAELVVDARRTGSDPGAGAILARYDARRRPDAALRFAATGGLNRLASNDLTSLRVLRELGMAGLGIARPLRRFLMARGMAGFGPEPRLAAGRPLL